MAIILPVVLVISKLFSFFSLIYPASDTITQSQPLPDGSTLVSSGGTFELGFFNPGNSTNRYVGIWYQKIPVRRVVWVANPENPIKDNSSKLIISQDGNLVLLSQNHTLLWSTNTTTTTTAAKARSPIVQLLDNGNLVLKDGNKDNNNEQSFWWQSFDHPYDTLLPGMKFRWDRKNGISTRAYAWKSWDDPSPGDFTGGLVHGSNPEVVMWQGSVLYYREGPWNGIQFSGTFALKANPLFNYKFVNDEDEVYFMYTLKNSSVISIEVMNQTLYRRQNLIWVPQTSTWTVYQSVPQDTCDAYNLCGAYGNCVADASPVCQCLDGFQPKSPQNWNAMDWRQGCLRRDTWSCGVKDRDGFHRFAGMKLPDTTHSWVDRSMTLEDCKDKCLGNCSCTAYANLDIRGAGSGCAIWYGDLNDLRVSQDGQDLYVRMATSDAKHSHTKKVVLVVTVTSLLVLMVLLALCYIYRCKTQNREKAEKTMPTEKKEGKQEDLELPFFNLSSIVNATNNFSADNKLGEGGFGPVYKGTLPHGEEIAIKRLSRSSGQGLKEFKNEVIFCAKLQHRNLVKVLGYCIEEEEKMLLYEYLPNKSLDSFIFDSSRSKLLDWSKRFHILYGIARGLLYLHQDSRLRIIHRDLKASNILLDNDMNPKISDFGMARMFGGDQIEGNTKRIVGTYGYMAPEYAIDGLFSIKSDVFSFGILLLEIISGKKNKGLTYPSNSLNLIGHAWRLWTKGILEEFIDAGLRDSCILSEAIHCIQIGLLCLQRHPDDRPNMSSVVLMLNSQNTLPQPKEPGFLFEKVLSKGEQSYGNKMSCTINEITISELSAR